MGAQAKLERCADWLHLVDVPVADIEKILLPKVRRGCADLGGNPGMIIDHQPHAGVGRDWSQALGQARDLLLRPILGPKLHEIRPAVAKLAAQYLGVAAIEIGRVNERVQQTIRQRFHLGYLAASTR